jgi:hypothetical protein
VALADMGSKFASNQSSYSVKKSSLVAVAVAVGGPRWHSAGGEFVS